MFIRANLERKESINYPLKSPHLRFTDPPFHTIRDPLSPITVHLCVCIDRVYDLVKCEVQSFILLSNLTLNLTDTTEDELEKPLLVSST